MRPTRSLPSTIAKRDAAPPDLASRRIALARAERVAASLEDAAVQAQFAALSPTEQAAYRAGELRVRAGLARYEADQSNRRLAREEARLPAVPATVRAHLLGVPDAAVKAAVEAAQKRILDLKRLHEMAVRHDVGFDLEAAITGGVSIERLRGQICDAMADASEATATYSRSTHHMISEAIAAAGWDESLRRVLARRGQTLSR